MSLIDTEPRTPRRSRVASVLDWVAAPPMERRFGIDGDATGELRGTGTTARSEASPTIDLDALDALEAIEVHHDAVDATMVMSMDDLLADADVLEHDAVMADDFFDDDFDDEVVAFDDEVVVLDDEVVAFDDEVVAFARTPSDTKAATADGARTATIDPRFARRRAEVEEDTHRRVVSRRMIWAVVCGLLAMIPVAGYALLRSDVMAVRTISVDGAEFSGAMAVVTAGGVRVGDSMMDVDTGAVARRIESMDLVDSAVVERKWPDRLVITVVERVPVAAIQSTPGRWYAIDRDGTVLTTSVNPPQGLAIVVVTTSATEQPEQSTPTLRTDSEGRTVVSSDARNAAVLIADLPEAVRNRLSDIQAGQGGVTAQVRVGERTVAVQFGRGADGAAKGKALLTVLSEANASSLAAIDISVPDVPILDRG
jgi:cell division protein FtsQ